MNLKLQIFPFRGIDTDCLGHYLMGLGLLRAVASRWAEARGFWYDGTFHLAGSFSQEEISGFLQSEWQPTPYKRWWSDDQKADTKAKTAVRVWQARSLCTVPQVRIADSTIVPAGRNQFNPLFGTGGNIGKRNLESAWREALSLIAKPNSPSWLQASLFGNETTEVPPFTNGGTWFAYNNKTFNSGLEWYREGSLSPWSFLLALEGALLIRGGSGRRLGAKARPYAVFPFICQPVSPADNQEVGQKTAGEFWAPIWEQPATLGEIRALFQRGQARLGGRAATAPHEFAVAALAAGTDSGITSFVRFELRQTTSHQVYEALPRQTFTIQGPRAAGKSANPSTLLESFLGSGWFDKLPKEPTSRDSKKTFSGLRGPIERLILSLAADPNNPAVWCDLWLKLANAQGHIDRNSELRKSCRTLPWLSPSWLAKAFPDSPPVELRLAAALASLGAGTNYPAQCNIFGVEVERGNSLFCNSGRPARSVWHDGDAESALLDLVERRLVDCEAATGLSPMNGTLYLAPAEITQFLNSDPSSLKTIQDWIPALTLIDWTAIPDSFRRTADRVYESELLLWAFFKPFFFGGKLQTGNEKICFATRPSFSRQLFYSLRCGAWAQAINLACSGYQAHDVRVLAPIPSSLNATRVAAALALSVSASDLEKLVLRWLEPSNQNRNRG